MTQIAIIQRTVEGLESSVPGTLERVSQAGYDGIEFSHGGIDTASITEIQSTLRETNLEVASSFVDFDELENNPKPIVETYRNLGCSRLVGGYTNSAFDSVESVKETATRLTELQNRLDQYDMKLLYHNHGWEFNRFDGQTAFDILLNETDAIQFELDIGLAYASGANPIELLERMGEQVLHLHMKDVQSGNHESVEIGTGDVDLRRCAEVATDIGVEWLIYEHLSTDNPRYTLNNGSEYLSSLV